MGHVIEMRRARATNARYRCARCGTDLWNLLADGRVRCADCEEECPLRTVAGSGNASAHEYDIHEGE